MGACMSSAGGAEVSERDRVLHRQAEKSLKEAKAKLALQVKVLLLGSGDSGKSTILKQMRLIHRVPFSPQETESFRQLVFDNLTRGLKYPLDALPDMALELLPAYTPPEGEAKRLGWEEGASIEPPHTHTVAASIPPRLYPAVCTRFPPTLHPRPRCVFVDPARRRWLYATRGRRRGVGSASWRRLLYSL
ncbi:G-protein alpha subunit-domain-containing protein [Mycena latifolia]|nr:G-protein alpha subunit-domain-containing protein [Mycena latifolia]